MSRLEAALELVAISSVSRDEAALARHVETVLRDASHLEVERVGDNVIARTTGRHATRLLVAGHLDTVPGDATNAAIDGDRLVGVGACDMKGSVAVMLELALEATPRSVEVTWVFYAREEIARVESGLLEIAQLRPDLLQGDAVVLAEPTNGALEAGCQGSLRATIELRGVRAHAARPYAGRNAIHRLGEVVARVAAYQPRRVELDGVTYVEQLQAVEVSGGVAANVLPDQAVLTVNHRFAPDRSHDEATAWLAGYLENFLEDGDSFEVRDWAPAAVPGLTDGRLAALVALTGRAPSAKVGWTDVATFAERGVPAANFGAGDPLLAHRSDEFVTAAQLDEFARVLSAWLA